MIDDKKVTHKIAEIIWNSMTWEQRIKLSEVLEADSITQYYSLEEEQRNLFALLVGNIAMVVLNEIEGQPTVFKTVHDIRFVMPSEPFSRWLIAPMNFDGTRDKPIGED